jgi:hypothetical protein
MGDQVHLAMNYDDDAVLAEYVWTHFDHLMTAFEREVRRVIIWRTKADRCNDEAMAWVMKQKFGRVGDPEIDAALHEGSDAFLQRVCRRALAEFGSSVFINRCPRCNRVVRTPRARQCFWCGYDWHEPTS